MILRKAQWKLPSCEGPSLTAQSRVCELSSCFWMGHDLIILEKYNKFFHSLFSTVCT